MPPLEAVHCIMYMYYQKVYTMTAIILSCKDKEGSYYYHVKYVPTYNKSTANDFEIINTKI